MAQLQGKVGTLDPGSHGFDCNSPVSPQAATAMKHAGFTCCIRYLSRSDGQSKHDLSNAEAADIVAAGLSLGAVQHVEGEGWLPTAAKGQLYGENAAKNAQAIGLPPGMTLWLDLEGIGGAATSDEVIAYCNAWFDEIEAADYESGIYVGAKCVLDGDELFWKPKTTHYWKSGSNVPAIPQRGYQMVQHISAKPDIVAGLSIDRNVTFNDTFGQAVSWLNP